MGLIFQFYNLIPVLSALENVELPLLLTSLKKKERRERALTALKVVGLADRASHYPRQLSGGQEQRVAIARAIVADPRVLVADEPTGDLDAKSAHEILDLIGTLNRDFKKTIVMVTHDPRAAERGRDLATAFQLTNIIREFTERYPHAFGLQASSSGHSGPIYLKSLMLVGYAAGVLGVLLIRDLRRNRLIRGLLVVTAVYFLILAIIDGQKQTTYLIHIVPLYLVFIGSVIGWMWRMRIFPRFVLVGAVLAVIAVPLGGMALKISQNTRGRYYKPMIAYLDGNMGPEDHVMAGADLAFGLGFDPRLIADGRFGYLTGKRPRYIVYDSAVEISWAASKVNFPAFYEYFPRLLREEYRVAYENDAYKVYEKHTP